MPNVITGNAANITTPLVRNVTGAVSSGGLIKITTSVAHLFSTGDIVTCVAVGGVPNANGTFAIAVVDSTHFTLDGSSFSGSYTSGGTATDYSLTPAFDIIADGEQLTADNFAVSFQALADRTQYLVTLARRNATQITVAPLVSNVSYAANWLVGDNGIGSGTGQYLLHASNPTSDTVLVELTPFLVGQDGRKLVQCNPVFAVGQSHSAVPAVLPEIKLFVTQSLTALGVGPGGLVSMVAAGGVFFPTPGSGSAYYDSGVIQTWTVATDQNNVIDSTKRYLAAIVDENGANAKGLNAYLGFQLFLS